MYPVACLSPSFSLAWEFRFNTGKIFFSNILKPFQFLFLTIIKRTAQSKPIEEEVENKYDENEIIEDEPYIPATQTNLHYKKIKNKIFRVSFAFFVFLKRSRNKVSDTELTDTFENNQNF